MNRDVSVRRGWSWDSRSAQRADELARFRAFALAVRRRGGRTDLARELQTVVDWIGYLRDDRKQGRVPAWLVAELERIPGWR